MRAIIWLVVTGALVLVNFADRSKPPKSFFFHWDSAGAIALNSILLFIVPAALLARGDWNVLGFARPQRLGATAGYAVLAIAGTGVLTAIVDAFHSAGDEQGLAPTHWLPHHTGQFALNLALISLLVPLAEESFFRGIGYGLLARVYSVPGAIFLTGCLFGLAHGLLIGFLPLAFLGGMLALMRTTSGSIVPGIVLHGMYNAAAVVLTLHGF